MFDKLAEAFWYVIMYVVMGFLFLVFAAVASNELAFLGWLGL